ncbi:MAG: barnase inhibitor [Bacteroidia bacterium]|nr:barnase inhibitor [Bacteroidia bacterium]
MKQVTFDFENIRNIDDFYTEAAAKLDLPDYFGNNLDAMWDCLTGEIELPIEIRFINLTSEQLDEFVEIILLFEDAAFDMDEDLFFEYSLKEDEADLLLTGDETE